MLKNILVLIILLGCFFSVYAQTEGTLSDSSQCDSLNREMVYRSWPSALNFYSLKTIKGVEAWESGFCVCDKREGMWAVTNNNGKLIGHRLYKDDNLIVEIQYRRRRVSAIIRSEPLYTTSDESGLESTCHRLVDIVIFDKRGRIKQRKYQALSGEMITVEY